MFYNFLPIVYSDLRETSIFEAPAGAQQDVERGVGRNARRLDFDGRAMSLCRDRGGASKLSEIVGGRPRRPRQRESPPASRRVHRIGSLPTVPAGRTRKGGTEGEDEILLRSLDVVKVRAN